MSAFGSQLSPDSGMQYTQRKLQRSVTEMRRYSMARPNWSTLDMLALRVDPLGPAVEVVLPLPDRQALLELFDHVSRRFIGLATMRMRDRDCNAGLTQVQRTDAMLDHDVACVPALRGLEHDPGELLL